MVESQVKQLIFIFLLYLYNLTLCSHFNDWNLWLNINPFCSKTILTSPTTVYTPQKGFSCPFLLRKNKTKKPVKLCPYSHWTIYTTSSSVFFSYIFSCHLVNCGPSHSPSMSWHPSLSPQKTHPALGPPQVTFVAGVFSSETVLIWQTKPMFFFQKKLWPSPTPNLNLPYTHSGVVKALNARFHPCQVIRSFGWTPTL